MRTTLKQFKRKQAKQNSKRLGKKNYPKDLVIVAEGDSWFDYPLKKDILDYLSYKGYAIKKLSKAGDTLENMVYGLQYNKNGTHKGPESLRKTLIAVKQYKPQFVLFSAGGNDIVGSEIANYLNHAKSKSSNLINKKIFREKILSMKSTIEYFIQEILKVNKMVHIYMDGYDYAKVNGKGYKFIFNNIKGPWLLPTLSSKAITNKKQQKEIIKYLVDEFNKMLKSLDRKYPNFHHIDLRGKFPTDREWDNEIHLKNNGYKKIANIYHSKFCQCLKHDPIETFQKELIV